MARSFTVLALRTRCQQRCDKEHDSSIATAEWNALLSEAYGELCGVVAETGLRYFERTQTLTTTGAASYDVPTDILALIGIDYLSDGTTTGSRRSLDEIMVQERTQWGGLTGSARAFALAGDQLYLYPNPTSGTYEWIYIPQATDLTSAGDSDLVDVVTPEGERFLIWCVAVKALAKSESDVQLAIAEREAAKEALREWAVLRAFNAPRRRIVREAGPDSCGPWDEADWWNR